jgi:hypothetical protein
MRLGLVSALNHLLPLPFHPTTAVYDLLLTYLIPLQSLKASKHLGPERLLPFLTHPLSLRLNIT